MASTVSQRAVSPVLAPEKWETSFGKMHLRQIREREVRGRFRTPEGRVRLITRSGFEQKYIVTSQIASM